MESTANDTSATAQPPSTLNDDTLIVRFRASMTEALAPHRGRFSIEFYPSFLKLCNNNEDDDGSSHLICYDNISCFFLLPQPDFHSYYIIVALNKPPAGSGDEEASPSHTTVRHWLFQCTNSQDEIQFRIDEKLIKEKYGDSLFPTMRASRGCLFAKILKEISNKVAYIPGKFASSKLRCFVRTHEGLLYPFEKRFVLVNKDVPDTIPFNQIELVQFCLPVNATADFTMRVKLKAGSELEHLFSSIDRSEYGVLWNFLSPKKIPVCRVQDTADGQASPPLVATQNEKRMRRDAANLKEEHEKLNERKRSLMAEIEQLPPERRARLETDIGSDLPSDKMDCVICHNFLATRVVIPCGHCCLCSNCANVLGSGPWESKLCPLCRGPIVCTIRLFVGN